MQINEIKISPLKALQALFPEEGWRAVRISWGWDYEGKNGARAGYRSCLSPQYDSDDETCVSRFFIYRQDKPTQELSQWDIFEACGGFSEKQ